MTGSLSLFLRVRCVGLICVWVKSCLFWGDLGFLPLRDMRVPFEG